MLGKLGRYANRSSPVACAAEIDRTLFNFLGLASPLLGAANKDNANHYLSGRSVTLATGEPRECNRNTLRSGMTVPVLVLMRRIVVRVSGMGGYSY